MRFVDRGEAAGRLANQLQHYRNQPLVLGVPRGGAPMAAIVADCLGCGFDLVLVRKLRLPGQPDVAVGAVDEAGHIYRYGARTADARRVDAEAARQIGELRRRRRLYSHDLPPATPTGCTAIIVDDGMATGASMVAAIRAVRAQRPLRIVVAVPVAARSALELAKSYADDVVCLFSPRIFFAIGDFYDDFARVTDAQVVEAVEVGLRHRA